MDRIECQSCGGEGRTEPGELHDLDPLWYDEDDEAPCFTCHGEAAWMVCVSTHYGEEEDSPGGDWCEAHPLPGREAQKSAPEWFMVREARRSGGAGSRDSMGGMDPYETWLTTRVRAEMWWCGDEHCNCTQPQIDRITPNHDAGYPWIKRERLWEGEFQSDASAEESLAQWRELIAAAEKYGAEKWWHPDSVPDELRESAGGGAGRGER
jgi:hypothetical protein